MSLECNSWPGTDREYNLSAVDYQSDAIILSFSPGVYVPRYGYAYSTMLVKNNAILIYDNFGKYRPISIIFHL